MDADIGHVDPAVPVAMGISAEVFSDKNNFTIKYKWN